MPLAGGSLRRVDNIPLYYALVFDADGRGLVSAGPVGEEEIVLLDNDPDRPARSVIVNIPGFSGPLVLDGEGNLYYGTADLMERSQVLRRFQRGHD